MSSISSDINLFLPPIQYTDERDFSSLIRQFNLSTNDKSIQFNSENELSKLKYLYSIVSSSPILFNKHLFWENVLMPYLDTSYDSKVQVAALDIIYLFGYLSNDKQHQIKFEKFIQANEYYLLKYLINDMLQRDNLNIKVKIFLILSCIAEIKSCQNILLILIPIASLIKYIEQFNDCDQHRQIAQSSSKILSSINNGDKECVSSNFSTISRLFLSIDDEVISTHLTYMIVDYCSMDNSEEISNVVSLYECSPFLSERIAFLLKHTPTGSQLSISLIYLILNIQLQSDDYLSELVKGGILNPMIRFILIDNEEVRNIVLEILSNILLGLEPNAILPYITFNQPIVSVTTTTSSSTFSLSSSSFAAPDILNILLSLAQEHWRFGDFKTTIPPNWAANCLFNLLCIPFTNEQLISIISKYDVITPLTYLLNTDKTSELDAVLESLTTIFDVADDSIELSDRLKQNFLQQEGLSKLKELANLRNDDYDKKSQTRSLITSLINIHFNGGQIEDKFKFSTPTHTKPTSRSESDYKSDSSQLVVLAVGPKDEDSLFAKDKRLENYDQEIEATNQNCTINRMIRLPDIIIGYERNVGIVEDSINLFANFVQHLHFRRLILTNSTSEFFSGVSDTVNQSTMIVSASSAAVGDEWRGGGKLSEPFATYLETNHVYNSSFELGGHVICSSSDIDNNRVINYLLNNIDDLPLTSTTLATHPPTTYGKGQPKNYSDLLLEERSVDPTHHELQRKYGTKSLSNKSKWISIEGSSGITPVAVNILMKDVIFRCDFNIKVGKESRSLPFKSRSPVSPLNFEESLRGVDQRNKYLFERTPLSIILIVDTDRFQCNEFKLDDFISTISADPEFRSHSFLFKQIKKDQHHNYISSNISNQSDNSILPLYLFPNNKTFMMLGLQLFDSGAVSSNMTVRQRIVFDIVNIKSLEISDWCELINPQFELHYHDYSIFVEEMRLKGASMNIQIILRDIIFFSPGCFTSILSVSTLMSTSKLVTLVDFLMTKWVDYDAALAAGVRSVDFDRCIILQKKSFMLSDTLNKYFSGLEFIGHSLLIFYLSAVGVVGAITINHSPVPKYDVKKTKDKPISLPKLMINGLFCNRPVTFKYSDTIRMSSYVEEPIFQPASTVIEYINERDLPEKSKINNSLLTLQTVLSGTGIFTVISTLIPSIYLSIRCKEFIVQHYPSTDMLLLGIEGNQHYENKPSISCNPEKEFIFIRLRYNSYTKQEEIFIQIDSSLNQRRNFSTLFNTDEYKMIFDVVAFSRYTYTNVDLDDIDIGFLNQDITAVSFERHSSLAINRSVNKEKINKGNQMTFVDLSLDVPFDINRYNINEYLRTTEEKKEQAINIDMDQNHSALLNDDTYIDNSLVSCPTSIWTYIGEFLDNDSLLYGFLYCSKIITMNDSWYKQLACRRFYVDIDSPIYTHLELSQNVTTQSISDTVSPTSENIAEDRDNNDIKLEERRTKRLKTGKYPNISNTFWRHVVMSYQSRLHFIQYSLIPRESINTNHIWSGSTKPIYSIPKFLQGALLLGSPSYSFIPDLSFIAIKKLFPLQFRPCNRLSYVNDQLIHYNNICWFANYHTHDGDYFHLGIYSGPVYLYEDNWNKNLGILVGKGERQDDQSKNIRLLYLPAVLSDELPIFETTQSGSITFSYSSFKQLLNSSTLDPQHAFTKILSNNTENSDPSRIVQFCKYKMEYFAKYVIVDTKVRENGPS